MPANLTPEYLQAEEDFRKATTIEEKIEALQRMLALLPKHKGTERIQADIKRRLAKLKEMEQQQRAKRGGSADPFYIPRHGAGQVIAVGFANVGKSALLSALSGVPLEVADYPYTTQRPQPVMMPYENLQIQLVDTPPILGEVEPAFAGMVRRADAALIIVDLSTDDCFEQADLLLQGMEARRVRLVGEPFDDNPANPVVEATYLTALRTAAAGALSIRTFANPDAKVAALIGAGVQGRFQLLALQEVLPRLQKVRIWSRDEELAWQLHREMQPQLPFALEVCSRPEDAVRGAQVIITATPSREPIVLNEWVSAGTHITCIGADAPGKQELDPALLKRARIFLDDLAQGMESGEVNVPLRQGLLKPEDIIGELGEVLVGKKQGRTSPDDITVFSSTGLALQDLACGAVLLRKLGVIG